MDLFDHAIQNRMKTETPLAAGCGRALVQGARQAKAIGQEEIPGSSKRR